MPRVISGYYRIWYEIRVRGNCVSHTLGICVCQGGGWSCVSPDWTAYARGKDVRLCMALCIANQYNKHPDLHVFINSAILQGFHTGDIRKGLSLQNAKKNWVKNLRALGVFWRGPVCFQDGDYAGLLCPMRYASHLDALANVNMKSQHGSVTRYPSLKGYVLISSVHYVIYSVLRCVFGTHV